MAQRGRKPNKSNKPKVNTPNIIYCANCQKEKKSTEFYASSSIYHANTGKIQFCKDCCVSLSCDKNNKIDINKLKIVLEKIDKPFLPDVLQSAYDESKRNSSDTKEIHPLVLYFKNINSLPQYKGTTWKDSLFEGKNKDNNTTNLNNKPESFEPDDDIFDKWGFGYSNEEYYYFERKWSKLIDNYGQKTSFHDEGLITYIRFRVKEELATARGDSKEAKEWGTMAAKAADDAKINVRQLSKSDISGGIELVPQIFEAVESNVGVISIMPKLKAQPYDDADLIIWCIVNYIRGLEDKSRVSYKDIWNFYDEMLENEKHKRNAIFRDLGEVYKEPIYEEDEK